MKKSPFFSSSFALLASFAAALLLSGCGVSVQQAASSALPGVAISGHVHGGVYPIQGATIRLMETQSNGVWSTSTNSYQGTAKQLLQTTSDSNGYFTFPDTGWTCDAGQYAYITVTSGHTGSYSQNNNVGQIGVIGACSAELATVSQIDKVNVFISELSTIAAAYTLGNFIYVDDTNAATGQQLIHITAPANNNQTSGVCTKPLATTCTGAGLAHGFENAYNLVDSVRYDGSFPTGQARPTLPNNRTAMVPQAMINTLGNILQSCVDSAGGASTPIGRSGKYRSDGSHCGDLFFDVLPPNGVPPTNTLEAALDMARNPTNNVATLFALQPRAVFFTPTIPTSSAPHDLSLSVFYLTQQFATSASTLTHPIAVALDANDDAFVVTSTETTATTRASAVLGVSSNGDVLFTGPLDTTHLYPVSIAVDNLNNILFTNNDPGSSTAGAILKASAQLGTITTATLLPYAAGLAVDRTNNVWASTAATGTANSLRRYTSALLVGGTVTPALTSGNTGAAMSSIAVDASQNIWSVTSASGNASAVVWPNSTPTGTATYPANFSAQGLNSSAGFGVAANASGEVFFPLKGQLNDAIYSGSLTTNNLGTFTAASGSSATYSVPNQAAVDGSGSVYWADTEASGQLFQFVPSSAGNMNQGTLNSILPCYPDVNSSYACYVPAVANGRSMAVDSTGALWYVADATYYGNPIGVLIQTFGLGSPTWPQLSYGHPGAIPQ